MLCLLHQAGVGLSLNLSYWEVSSVENHLQLLDGHLQVSEAFLHGVAEIQHLKRPLHFFLQPLPMYLVAMQAYGLVDAAVDISKPPQTIAYPFNGGRRRRDERTYAVQSFLNFNLVGMCHRRPACRSVMAGHVWDEMLCNLSVLRWEMI